MKVLVFGGSGFLGSYVVDQLVERGYEVTVYDIKNSIAPNRKVQYILGDIMDDRKVAREMENFDVVYNFSGLADLNESIEHPRKTIELNILGNLNILEACVKCDISKIIYASTAYVFSRKGAFYGVSKKSSEMIIEEYSRQNDLDYVIIRYGSVYGDRADSSNRIFRLLHEALTNGKIVFPGDGSEVREYIHAKDAAKLSVDILSEEYINRNILLTGTEKFTYLELLSLFQEIIGEELKIEFLNDDYKGHYILTPYSFAPVSSIKLMNNPSIDFGQGIIDCLEKIHHDILTKNVVCK
jgi:UDP-glucose 4-epimerase